MRGRAYGKLSLGLALAIAGVAIVAATAGGAWWWWKANADRLEESATAARVEGQRAGATLNERECLARAISRHGDKDNQTLFESVNTNIGLGGCLETSKVEKMFCDGVPAKSDLLSHATWAALRCSSYGFSDSYCPQMMGQVADYCFSEKRAAKR